MEISRLMIQPFALDQCFINVDFRIFAIWVITIASEMKHAQLVVSTVSADGLAPNGARPSADTMMINV